MLGEAYKIPLNSIGGVCQRLGTRLALRDDTRQAGTFGHEHPILILLDNDAILQQDLHC